MLHTRLLKGWLNLWITPDTVKAVLSVVNKGANLAKVQIIQLSQLVRYLLKVAVYALGFGHQLLVLLLTHVLFLDLQPALDFVQRADDATELIFLKRRLPQRGTALAQRSLKTGLKRV